MSEETYDVLVVGAGPAGATAATLLAQNGRRVALVEQRPLPLAGSTAAWLNARALPLLTQMEVATKAIRANVFDEITFHRADFSETATPKFEEAPGYLVNRADFVNALVKGAKKASVDVLGGAAVRDIRLSESSVSIDVKDAASLEGRLLLYCAGRRSPLVDRLGITAIPGESPIWSAQVDVPVKASAAPSKPRVSIILGLNRAGSFGFFSHSRVGLSIGVHWIGSREEVTQGLVSLCRKCAEHGLCSVDLSSDAVKSPVVLCPASAALDMESHVGKHALVLGDAGGFVAAASNEGIYPAMWSALIGVEVIESALQSAQSQDELMGFDSIWRMQMADYLRSPHTDIQFLLPLIFTNQPMADRMGAAFFGGENI